MAQADALRWDRRYQSQDRTSEPRDLLVKNYRLIPSRGYVLDVAMGLGENLNFLHQHGYAIAGVDISWVAAQAAKRLTPAAQIIVADLEQYQFLQNQFDCILNYYYLWRPLVSNFYNILKKNGLVFFETLTEEMLSQAPDLEPSRLLHNNELRSLFDGILWKTLYYFEGWVHTDLGKDKAIASMIVQKVG
jgi:tellurite methyltransferase